MDAVVNTISDAVVRGTASRSRDALLPDVAAAAA